MAARPAAPTSADAYGALEEALEMALFAAADRIHPSPDGIARIRAGAELAAARRDRRWWRRWLRRQITTPAQAPAATADADHSNEVTPS